MDRRFSFFLCLSAGSNLAAMPTCLTFPKLIHKICERFGARLAYSALRGYNRSDLMCCLAHLRNHCSESRFRMIGLDY